MKNFLAVLMVGFMLAPGSFVYASEDHAHEEKAEAKHEHEEAPANVGPNKGITEFNEDAGFKLSAEAVKNFALKFQSLSGKAPWSIPSAAILYSGEEVNVFRLREGFYKRIDFKVVSKNAKQTQIQSTDLQPGDQIVTEGIGFLRAAEIVVTGGAPEGHSH